MIKKFLILAVSSFIAIVLTLSMAGCTVVETTEPDYYEETRCNYHFENDCGEEFIIKEEIMTEEKLRYYERYGREYGQPDYACGLYKLTYRDGCHGFVTYY